jgi:hypothetical protein
MVNISVRVAVSEFNITKSLDTASIVRRGKTELRQNFLDDQLPERQWCCFSTREVAPSGRLRPVFRLAYQPPQCEKYFESSFHCWQQFATL